MSRASDSSGGGVVVETEVERGDCAVAVTDLAAGYHAVAVVDGVRLHLERGRFLAVMGPGGSGKSTLLKALTGSGGSEFWSRGSVRTVRSGLQIQEPDLSGEAFRSALARHSERGETAVEVIERLWGRENDVVDRLTDALEGGEDRLEPATARLASLTLVALEDVDMRVLDEPDLNLTESELLSLEGFLKSLEGSVVLATHNLRLARRTADEILLLIDGRVETQASTEVFFTEPSTPRAQHFVRMGS